MQKLGVLAALLLIFAPAAVADVLSTAGPYIPQEPDPPVNSDEYIYDDGSTENSLGLTAGGDLCHMHMFDPIAGLAEAGVVIGLIALVP